MKILQLVQTLDPSTGGVARAVAALSEGLARRGHLVEIVTLDDENSRWLRDFSQPVHTLGAGLTSVRYSKKLLPWLRTHAARFDCAIVNGLWQYMSFAAWRAFAGAPLPYFVFPHGMLDPWFKKTYPLKHAKKWLTWPWSDYRVLRDARAVIFTSEEERLLARESFSLYSVREKISPLGIASPPASSSEEFLLRFPELRAKRLLLFLGRLNRKKGCDLLLDAFRKVAPENCALVLAGPDQWSGELQKRAGKNVIFPGMLDGSLKWSALSAAEVFTLPSHQENFGLSVVEALSLGLPVLISQRVNIWREIENDEAGYVESDDAPGTENLLRRWFATSENNCAEMRANALHCFKTRFEIERAVESLLAILQEARPAK